MVTPMAIAIFIAQPSKKHMKLKLTLLDFITPNIFSIDVHDFVTPKESLHQHYDFNFLFQTRDLNDRIKISDESIDLQWFSELPEQSKTTENPNRFYRRWQQWVKGNTLNDIKE